MASHAGEKTFTLRDFVTYGDVIRIKLPYKDSEFASNQYIWLENHQSGKMILLLILFGYSLSGCL